MNNKIKLYGIANEEKQIGIFEMTTDGKVKVYDGHKYGKLTREEYKEIKAKPRTSSHLLIRREERDDNVKTLSLRKQHKFFMQEAEIMKIATGGKINRFMTGSFAKAALKLFNTYDLPKLDPIQSFEADIFESCYNGALIYGIPYIGKGYKYDICSQYPAIMRNNCFMVPLSEGQLEHYTQKELDDMEFIRYGIYHVKITGSDYRLFKTNSRNWYVHTEVTRARTLKYKIEVVEDGKPNALRYYKLACGSKLFRGYIDYIYKLKAKGIKSAKKYLNVLHGALCQGNIITTDTSRNSLEIRGGKELLSLKPMGRHIETEHYVLDICKPSKRYEYDIG